MYILEIRCCGSTVAELSKLTYVEDKIIISPLFLCNIFEFSSKSNSSIYYLQDCNVLHLSCKYLQSLLTITVLLAEERKEMIGKLEISDRKDRKLERFQTACYIY